MKRITFPWDYTRQAMPTPGSENIAFHTQILNLQSVIGPATANNRQFSTRLHTAFVPIARGVQGIGGPQAGFIYGQPLTVRRNR